MNHFQRLDNEQVASRILISYSWLFKFTFTVAQVPKLSVHNGCCKDSYSSCVGAAIDKYQVLWVTHQVAFCYTHDPMEIMWFSHSVSSTLGMTNDWTVVSQCSDQLCIFPFPPPNCSYFHVSYPQRRIVSGTQCRKCRIRWRFCGFSRKCSSQ